MGSIAGAIYDMVCVDHCSPRIPIFSITITSFEKIEDCVCDGVAGIWFSSKTRKKLTKQMKLYLKSRGFITKEYEGGIAYTIPQPDGRLNRYFKFNHQEVKVGVYNTLTNILLLADLLIPVLLDTEERRKPTSGIRELMRFPITDITTEADSGFLDYDIYRTSSSQTADTIDDIPSFTPERPWLNQASPLRFLEINDNLRRIYVKAFQNIRLELDHQAIRILRNAFRVNRIPVHWNYARGEYSIEVKTDKRCIPLIHLPRWSQSNLGLYTNRGMKRIINNDIIHGGYDIMYPPTKIYGGLKRKQKRLLKYIEIEI